MNPTQISDTNLEAILSQHGIALGKTGAGKSSLMRLLVEFLAARKRRVCIIDPKGDWWGVKLMADGKTPGLPFIAFGDFKNPEAADVPINQASGKQVAELIVSGNRPCVIGFRGWMPGAQAKFWTDFASTIFNSNLAGGLTLIVDEIQNFAPKERTGFGDENMALHWTKRLLSEGRGLGLSIFCGSQRPQSVHNGVLTQCETLFAMRLLHDADCSAVDNWLSRTRDKERKSEIMTSIPEMKRGEAWVWSPEAAFGPKRIQFPMFATFDSFAPPQSQHKITGKTWASVDLDEVKSKLAAVIEEQLANDPKELRRRIAELEKAKPKPEVKEVPAFSKEEITKIERLQHSIDEFATAVNEANALIEVIKTEKDQLRSDMVDVMRLVKKSAAPVYEVTKENESAPIITMRPKRIGFHRPESNADSSLPPGERAILEALVQYPDGAGRKQLSVLTGFKRSTRDAYISRLSAKGYVSAVGDTIVATEEGQLAVPDAKPLPTGKELREFWLAKLPEGESAILAILINAGQQPVSRDAITDKTGFKRSTRDAYLSRMKAKMIVIESGRGMVQAAETLF